MVDVVCPFFMYQLLWTLPNNDKIKVFAITVAENSNDDIRPAQSLYDDFSDRGDLALRAFVGSEYLKGSEVTTNN